MTMPTARHDPTGPVTGPARHALAWRLAAWTLTLVVLAVVFAAYLDPSMAMQLAQQLWSCF